MHLRPDRLTQEDPPRESHRSCPFCAAFDCSARVNWSAAVAAVAGDRSKRSAGPAQHWRCAVSALLIGYARCSTDEQDLTVQREGLAGLGVTPDRIYVDHWPTGWNRERPGLREALAACREGDTLVVTKLDRLARSLPDARAIADELTARRVRLSLGGAVYDPTGESSWICWRPGVYAASPVGRLV